MKEIRQTHAQLLTSLPEAVPTTVFVVTFVIQIWNRILFAFRLNQSILCYFRFNLQFPFLSSLCSRRRAINCYIIIIFLPLVTILSSRLLYALFPNIQMPPGGIPNTWCSHHTESNGLALPPHVHQRWSENTRAAVVTSNFFPLIVLYLISVNAHTFSSHHQSIQHN